MVALPARLGLAPVRRVPAQQAAVLAYLEPLVASAVGVFAWGARFAPSGALGGLLICAGGLLVALERSPDAQERGPA